MQPCAKCHENPPKEGQRYCGPCFAAYMREYRKMKREGGKRKERPTWEALLSKWSRAVP